MNITSLTHLEIDYPSDSDLPVLTNIVKSHHTLEVLVIGEIIDHDSSTDPSDNQLELIKVADESQLKKLIFRYDELPPHIHEQYKHLLESQGY